MILSYPPPPPTYTPRQLIMYRQSCKLPFRPFTRSLAHIGKFMVQGFSKFLPGAKSTANCACVQCDLWTHLRELERCSCLIPNLRLSPYSHPYSHPLLVDSYLDLMDAQSWSRYSAHRLLEQLAYQDLILSLNLSLLVQSQSRWVVTLKHVCANSP